MIDLIQIAEQFLDEAVRHCRIDAEIDKQAIAALKDQGQDYAVRVRTITGWMHYYRVLRGLNGSDASAVAGAILQFADAKRPIPTQGRDSLLARFDELYRMCNSAVRPKKDNSPRSLVSLASKGLWCCYPDVVPLFDANAERALWSITRLLRSKRPADQVSQYEKFVSIWLDVFQEVQHVIDPTRLAGYPFKIRVFDRILWIIGEPAYGIRS